ncbi:MAG: N-acetylmuramoyl-L-alanine amidase [Clostridia bacterium]|jgi:N-acetylmuramoyl-L-alanine amidase|nr:N-acetylmuramoyl-L-alanine amidase [Clostridia bacterium]MCI9459645.1 N-acetylmuramoyl-L-alanine amidase [Clostridia bacterium]
MAFITIRRKTLIAVLSIVLCAVVVAATAATVIAATRTDNGITIVIDAGHGGADGGVVGATTGTKESDVNLGISKYLMKHFKEAGYNVVLTRSDAGAVSGGIKYIKREDMRARKNIVESAAPDVLISVHCNSYPVASVKGAQVFYSSGASTGKNIAETVQNYFNEILNERPRTAAVGDYYMLNCSTYPSILCECGFLSNQTEENKLITASYQEKVAYTIFTAVNSVFGERA